MAEDFEVILDESIADTSKRTASKMRVLGRCRPDDGIVELQIEYYDMDGHLFSDITMKGKIENPLMTSIIIGVATSYGLCVSARTIASAGKIMYKNYAESKRAAVKLSIKDRTIDLYKRLRENKTEFKGEGIKSLIRCALRVND